MLEYIWVQPVLMFVAFLFSGYFLLNLSGPSSCAFYLVGKWLFYITYGVFNLYLLTSFVFALTALIYPPVMLNKRWQITLKRVDYFLMWTFIYASYGLGLTDIIHYPFKRLNLEYMEKESEVEENFHSAIRVW